MTDGDAKNLRIYNAPDIAAHYAALDSLTPCERTLFATYIRQGSAILDLGVGGGRTTSYLANRGSRYVGVDYAPEMIRVCKEKFPDLAFVVGDAADLSRFTDSSFDVVVFAFNGIDYVLPDEARRDCFAHIFRVLKAGGIFILSSHNARAVLVAPRWNADRLRRAASRFSAGSKIFYTLSFSTLTSLRATIAGISSLIASMPRLMKRIPSRLFWRGHGTLIDSVHGGLLTHYSTPDLVMDELSRLGFNPQLVCGNEYPRAGFRFATDWYYYVFAKPVNR